MKKIIYFIVLLFTFVSCSTNEQDDMLGVTQDDVKVVSLSDGYLTRTASDSNSLNNQVLKFRDLGAYDKILNQLDNMTISQKEEFFKTLGFRGAYTELNKADDELDKIFDIEDDNTFLNEISKYKAKYEGIFVFNDSDKYDLSSYLPFTNDDLELVGNINGLVMIGDEVVAPDYQNPHYYDFLEPDSTAAHTRAMSGDNYRGYSASTFMIKQGKYQSTVQLGVGDRSGDMMIRFASQKKKKLWKRRHKCDYTIDKLTIGGFQVSNYYQPNVRKGVVISYLRTSPVAYLNARNFNGNVNCSYVNFHSGACPKPSVSSKYFSIYFYPIHK